MKINIADLPIVLRATDACSEGQKPAESILRVSAEKDFSLAADLAAGCMKWVWVHWLLETPAREMRDKVRFALHRGMEIQDVLGAAEWRPLHDLFLLHCAIFAADDELLLTIAARVTEATGDEENHGQLRAAAWCGALKWIILNDRDAAVAQFKLIWGAATPTYFRTGSKPMFNCFIKCKWPEFRGCQQADFERLWNRSRKDGFIRSETSEAVLVRLLGFPAEQLWCWAHAGLALLAHRKGIPVQTDPLWLPPHGLRVLDAVRCS